MKLFDPTEAKHFVSGAGVPAPSNVQSLSGLYLKLPPGGTLVEGSQAFDVHRASTLVSAERWLLYALVQYRRVFDMLIAGCSPWNQVTLYYASFFAANAILAMFGGWVGQARVAGKRNRVAQVWNSTPGRQTLLVERDPPSPNHQKGSHLYFWDMFYDAAVRNLKPWAPPALAGGFDPVNQQFDWQIDERNRVNYDAHEAWNETLLFAQQFDPAPKKLRASLSGPLAQQLDTTEKMLCLAVYFATELQLDLNGLTGAGHTGTRAQIQRRLVSKGPPSAALQSIVSQLLE